MEKACVGATTTGGLLAFDDDEKDYYPWEDRLLSHYEVSETCAEENPYDVPEISGLLMAPSQKIPTSVMQGQGHSCFTTLAMGDSRSNCHSAVPERHSESA